MLAVQVVANTLRGVCGVCGCGCGCRCGCLCVSATRVLKVAPVRWVYRWCYDGIMSIIGLLPW
jgi:hypothetical protein